MWEVGYDAQHRRRWSTGSGYCFYQRKPRASLRGPGKAAEDPLKAGISATWATWASPSSQEGVGGRLSLLLITASDSIHWNLDLSVG